MNYLKKLKPITILTLFATFLMGFIDAYTFMKKGGVFVSAQTGNIIAFGSKLFTGKFTQAFKHVSVFFGFALGTFCGELIYEKMGGSTRRKYKLILLLQSCVLLFFALFQSDLLDFIMVFLLGWLAGFELTLFRKVGIATVNDGVMTGNTKSLMSSLYGWIVDKDLVSRKQFLDVGTTILVFILGVGIGSIVVSIHAILSLWISFILTVLFFIWVSISKVQMD